MNIDYNKAIYDHFPLCFDLNIKLVDKLISKESIYDDFVDWRKIPETAKVDMAKQIEDFINDSNILNKEAFSCGKVNCNNSEHIAEIDNAFSALKSILLKTTQDFSFSRVNKFRAIPGWNEQVKKFHNEARKSFLAWKENGKLLNGPNLERMKETRNRFRNALKSCKQNEDIIRRENLLRNLNSKNFSEFWRETNKLTKNKNQQLNVIDNLTDTESAVKLFSDKFRKIFDKHDNHKSDAELFNINVNNNYPEVTQFLFSGKEVQSAIKCLKPSIGYDNIHTNHLKLTSVVLEKCIANLFSSFVLHGYMSCDILKGIINPTVKDRYGDMNSSDNYRPVISSSVFLKLFEYCLQEKIKNIVSLDDRQHGFRVNYSTSTACLVLKETILNYTKSNSNVYACFIDISKAFDTVNHKILLKKLKQSGIPNLYINVIRYWYSNQFVRVRYGSSYSCEWLICNGVRQGGVLSGLFFSIYINSLLIRVANSKIGCKLGIVSSNIIAYADDIVILAPSVVSLQILINIAYSEAVELELSFNTNKSKCMTFYSEGRKPYANLSFHIGDKVLENVNSFKYLGFIINNNLSNSGDIDRARNKFYKEFNVILRKFSFACSRVKLYLFTQYCLQLYGAELWFNNKRSAASLKQFEIGYHKAIKKILGLSYHESNHYACQEANLYTFEHLINKIRIMYVIRLFCKPCSFIKKIEFYLSVSSVLCNEVSSLLKSKYDIDSLHDNDKEAIIARLGFVQNHEPQLRQAWV